MCFTNINKCLLVSLDSQTNLYNFRLSILPIRDNNNNFKFVTIDPRDEVLTSWGLPKSTGVSVLNVSQQNL